ncbi:Serine protease inhibitor Kazal-type 6 [Chelonia mydas]|uniref:Serine protease inhibitor Kazal-type 6 n=1 Tax=Chelonia mydas TaxID=8469 RepID=M7BIL2_CHEMY|nr:Serine protease inhibitor Kazal-type 6 [Chelonia mydas]
MKTAAAVVFLTLGLFSSFQDATANNGKVDCTRYPQAKEQGPFFCTKVYKPVCGTNDMTYGNKCLLCSAIWETGINIGMKHKGKCGEKGRDISSYRSRFGFVIGGNGNRSAAKTFSAHLPELLVESSQLPPNTDRHQQKEKAGEGGEKRESGTQLSMENEGECEPQGK